MARLPRLFAPGVPSHIIVRGNNRQAVFLGEGDKIYFHRCLAEQSAASDVRVHAYVLMTNHVHLLGTGARPDSVPSLVQRLGRRYVGYFNYLHGRTGTLWEGRYKSTLVEAERYFLTCQRYIELNPVRAGMVDHPGAYAWSSYRHAALGVPDDLVSLHGVYEDLGGDPVSRRKAYLELFENDIDEETLRKIRDSVQAGWVLGSDAFCESLKSRGARRPSRLPLGRPRQMELT
jgi:putative transposase